jgi:hypothetical protein
VCEEILGGTRVILDWTHSGWCNIECNGVGGHGFDVSFNGRKEVGSRTALD